MTRAVILASRIRSEEKDILAALASRRIAVTRLHTAQWWSALEETGPPAGIVVNREISWTRARYAARTLEATGATVLNCAAATETCGDKWLTALALRRAQLPMPRTALALDPVAGLAAAETFGYPVVIKPLVSSWGRRVSLVRDPDAACAVLEHCAALPSPQARAVCVQEYVHKPERDIRVVVVDRRVVGGMSRRGGWRTNVALGAEPERCDVSDEMAKLALAAADAVGAEIAGVDLIEAAAGALQILEVNHNVEFGGLVRAVPEADVAGAIADLVLARSEGR